MYDSVWVTCPVCNHRNSFQSKKGDCSAYDYRQDEVPIEIARDLDGEAIVCSNCGTKLQLFIPNPKPPETIEMLLTVFRR